MASRFAHGPKVRDQIAVVGFGKTLKGSSSMKDTEGDVVRISPMGQSYLDQKLAVEFAKPVIHALQEKGISKIGAAGFCWGAKVVVELAKDADIQVAALLHPTFVTLDDIKGVKVPVAILGAEFDKISPPELVDHFVKIFLGLSHGWTVRYRDENVTAVKSAQVAHQDIVDWFGKCLQTAHSAL
ncbi:hypothetical protein E3N88_40944 [Mikania micrantha]|uniref:Dienelactone hydrolase domain-containing protein n=1 Tax=Mikania micrantha TaxID=192012 RepID=A0A5N6LP52_9ASTR|nr:hypothetical protein E3N88_40944 [Mikania micrantha]